MGPSLKNIPITLPTVLWRSSWRVWDGLPCTREPNSWSWRKLSTGDSYASMKRLRNSKRPHCSVTKTAIFKRKSEIVDGVGLMKELMEEIDRQVQHELVTSSMEYGYNTRSDGMIRRSYSRGRKRQTWDRSAVVTWHSWFSFVWPTTWGGSLKIWPEKCPCVLTSSTRSTKKTTKECLDSSSQNCPRPIVILVTGSTFRE